MVKGILCHVWLCNRLPSLFFCQPISLCFIQGVLLIRDRSIDLSEHRVMLCNKEKETGFDSRTWKVTSVDVVGLLDLLNNFPT